MVDTIQGKRYDVNLVYSGSYDSISSFEIKRNPIKKAAFEFAKFVSKCLSDDFGKDRVYYPERDMLGGVNLFDEFDRVIEGSSVTLIIVSKDIGENQWLRWLNQSAYKREKDKFALKTMFLAAPGVRHEDIVSCRAEFMLVEHVVFSETTPTTASEVAQSSWYKRVKAGIREYTGRSTTNRQVSEQAQDAGTMSARPPSTPPSYENRGSRVIQSEEEVTNTVSNRGDIDTIHGPRGDLTPTGARAERIAEEPNLRAPEEVTDSQSNQVGVDGILPSTKAEKEPRSQTEGPLSGIDDMRNEGPQPTNVDTPSRNEDTHRQNDGLLSRNVDTGCRNEESQPKNEATPRRQEIPAKKMNDGTRMPGKWNVDWRKVAAAATVILVVSFVWHRYQ